MTQTTAIANDLEPANLALRVEAAEDAPAVEALNDRAFGPGRFAKVSYAVRELARFRPDLSFCAFDGEVLIGSVRQSEVSVGGRTILFLGPFAVAAEARRQGVGAALIEQALAAGEAAGFDAVLLVGDLPVFEKHGFRRTGASIPMPRPVNPRRLLWRPLREGAAEPEGPVGSPEA
jgi:predicted N-acetyltransferase YhbS